jgi:hypothetical protein
MRLVRLLVAAQQPEPRVSQPQPQCSDLRLGVARPAVRVVSIPAIWLNVHTIDYET